MAFYSDRLGCLISFSIFPSHISITKQWLFQLLKYSRKLTILSPYRLVKAYTSLFTDYSLYLSGEIYMIFTAHLLPSFSHKYTLENPPTPKFSSMKIVYPEISLIFSRSIRPPIILDRQSQNQNNGQDRDELIQKQIKIKQGYHYQSKRNGWMGRWEKLSTLSSFSLFSQSLLEGLCYAGILSTTSEVYSMVQLFIRIFLLFSYSLAISLMQPVYRFFWILSLCDCYEICQVINFILLQGNLRIQSGRLYSIFFSGRAWLPTKQVKQRIQSLKFEWEKYYNGACDPLNHFLNFLFMIFEHFPIVFGVKGFLLLKNKRGGVVFAILIDQRQRRLESLSGSEVDSELLVGAGAQSHFLYLTKIQASQQGFELEQMIFAPA